MTHSELADALRQETIRASTAAPAVRGADWRRATVSAVGDDGTVITTDGIIARRQHTYSAPTVGDVVVLSQSSSGNWRAEGPLVPPDGDAWVPVAGSFNSPWINYAGGGGFQVARYRKYPNGDVAIEGLVATGGTSVSGSSTVFTLPIGYRPQATQMGIAFTSGNAARQIEITNTGVVRYSNLPSGAISFITLIARFSTL